MHQIPRRRFAHLWNKASACPDSLPPLVRGGTVLPCVCLIAPYEIPKRAAFSRTIWEYLWTILIRKEPR